MSAIFLSAGVPSGPRAEKFPLADPYLIQAAVRGLVIAILGRRQLVWGGHPAITPMIWAAAEDLGVSYEHAVKLYQTRHFEDQFPEINGRFGNVVLVPKETDLRSSLASLRKTMFAENGFEGAVFIGGMEGVADEFEIFREMHPSARVAIVGTVGGASAILATQFPEWSDRGGRPFDYAGFFMRSFEIGPDEPRLERLEEHRSRARPD